MGDSSRFAVMVLAAAALAGCPIEGNGHRVVETRDLADFSGVSNDSPLEVVVEQGDHFEVSVAIDSNLIDHVETRVRDGQLQIGTDNVGGFHMVRGPHVRVTMPALDALRVSGAGDLEAYDFQDSDQLTLRVSGAGNLSWQGSAAEIDASVSGAGDLRLDGSADWLDLHVSGGGSADARACTASGAKLHVSGGGDADVTVDGEVDVTVSGAGDVDLYGEPHITHRDRSGAGDIRVH